MSGYLKTVIATTMLGVAAAHAADPPPSTPEQQEQRRFEAAAFAGFSLGGSFTRQDNGQRVDVADHGSFALAFDVEADPVSEYELFYSRESTVMRADATVTAADVTVEYLHIGGTLLLDEAPRVKPYLLGGLGATRFSPPVPGLVDTRFSASLGLGLRVPVNRHFQVRLEARGFLTLVSSNTSLFCRSDQTGLVCLIHGHGSTFLQGQALAGMAVEF